MAGPDRPPPAGPRGHQQGPATAYLPPPVVPPPMRESLRGRGGQTQRRKSRQEPWAAFVEEATQAFEQPTQALGSPLRRQAPQRQVAASTRYGLPKAGSAAGVSRAAASRGRLKRVGLLSVVKMSLAFYLCVFVVVMVAGAVLWNVAEAAGLIRKLDKLVRSLFALSNFQLHPLTALGWGGAAVGALCLLGVLANVLTAVFYNLLADLVGGLQVTVAGEEPARGANLMPASRAARSNQRFYDEGL